MRALVAKKKAHNQLIRVYAGLTRGCQYQPSGQPRATALVHATKGLRAPMEMRIKMVVPALLMIPGRKNPPADPDKTATATASAVPKSPASAKRIGLPLSSRQIVIPTAEPSPKTEATTTPHRALDTTNSRGGITPSAIPTLPNTTSLSSCRISPVWFMVALNVVMVVSNTLRSATDGCRRVPEAATKWYTSANHSPAGAAPLQIVCRFPRNTVRCRSATWTYWMSRVRCSERTTSPTGIIAPDRTGDRGRSNRSGLRQRSHSVVLGAPAHHS